MMYLVTLSKPEGLAWPVSAFMMGLSSTWSGALVTGVLVVVEEEVEVEVVGRMARRMVAAAVVSGEKTDIL